MTPFETYFNKVKSVKLALVEPGCVMSTMTVMCRHGKDFAIKDCFRMAQVCHFIYDLTNQKTIKCRYDMNEDEKKNFARMISMVGNDYGLVEMI